jgi:hypothetical protein
LEICESSPQNKTTGFNQFFEGKFRQFVGEKKNLKFFFGGLKFPILRKKKSQKSYFIFETAENRYNRLQNEPKAFYFHTLNST